MIKLSVHFWTNNLPKGADNKTAHDSGAIHIVANNARESVGSNSMHPQATGRIGHVGERQWVESRSVVQRNISACSRVDGKYDDQSDETEKAESFEAEE